MVAGRERPRAHRHRGPRRRRAPFAPPRRSGALGALDRFAATPGVAIALLFGLSTLLFATRVVPLTSTVFPAPGEVRLLGVDSYYHVRHARFAATHFPHLQRWDVATHYPEGHGSNATGLFDLAIGGLALLLAGGDAAEAPVEHVAAWAPAILGAASLMALFGLARRLLGRNGALGACSLFLLYPGESLTRTLLGFADHHAAEIFLSLLATTALLRCLEASGEKAPPPRWRPAFLHALPMACFLFTWNGAPIHLVVQGLSVLAALTVAMAGPSSARAVAEGALRYGTGLLAWVGGAALAWPDLVMEASHLPPLLLACGLLASGPALAWAIARRASGFGAPPVALALGLVAAILAGVGAAWSWIGEFEALAKRLLDVRTFLVSEHGDVDLRGYWRALGPPGILALAALPLGVARAWRGQREPAALIPTAAGSLLIALWWRTHDFGYVVPAFAALLAAVAMRDLLALARRLRKRRLSTAGAAALASAMVLPVWPLGTAAPPWPEPQAPRIHGGWIEAMGWMRANTPEPELPTDAYVGNWKEQRFPAEKSSYAVLTDWEFGNAVPALARRPVVWSRYPSPQVSSWLVEENEQRSTTLLCPTCSPREGVRYVATDVRTVGENFLAHAVTAGSSLERYHQVVGRWNLDGEELPARTFGPHYRRSMAARLHLDDGDDLSSYRLVYESHHESFLAYVGNPATVEGRRTLSLGRISLPIESIAQRTRYRELGAGIQRTAHGWVYEGRILSSVKIFERVAGARLVGTAPPGAAIEARLELRCLSTGRRFTYRREISPEPTGTFELTVAHATAAATRGTAVEALGPYVLSYRPESGARKVAARRVDVSQGAVLEGSRIDVGDLGV